MPVKVDIQNIVYRPARHMRQSGHDHSLDITGLDTEADSTGRCFLICTSLGDVYTPSDYPACFFTRAYRGVNFVAYNLKYDSGALLQHLPLSNLQELQQTDKTEYDGYRYRVIANKMLSVRRGKNAFHIYDMLNFYGMPLNESAKRFLNETKLDMSTKTFTREYIKNNYDAIVKYCIHDAVLVKRLGDVIIKQFEQFGVFPRKLYSVAYVSWQYFKNKCPWIHVKKFWYSRREVLDYAMQSYNGGKFEVTVKGTGYFYEYDIVSAYPYEISNLVDIREARVVQTKSYTTEAVYGFLLCRMKIPYYIYSPVVVKRGNVNYYPVGEFDKVITKGEYDYLISQGVDVTILNAYWLMVNVIKYPYRREIYNLMEYKNRFKREGKQMEYHTVKIFLNSFYGKMVQLIPKNDKYEAGSSWNPIYGSVITANTRIRVSTLQQQYNSIVAVHTDSVISTKKLPFQASGELGNIISEVEGPGVILGSGIYQVGSKSKMRGFETQTPLLEMLPRKGNILKVKHYRPHTWREIAHRNLETDLINRFENIERSLYLNFDTKRIWLNDYKDFREVHKRNVESIPWDFTVMTIR